MEHSRPLLAALMALGLIAPTHPASETGTVEGTIRGDGGVAVVGAEVQVLGTGLRIRTGRDGRYRLERVPAGPQRLAVTAVGFGADSVLVEVRPGAVVTLDIGLHRALNRPELLAGKAAKSEGIFDRLRGVPSPAPMRVGAQNAGFARRDFNTEEYRYFAENAWQAPSTRPLSTFSIDVDAGSYSNVRRFLNQGQLPPVDAVRVEEMINYFRYDYPNPRGEEPFSVTTELADAPWHPGHKLASIGLQGRRLSLEQLPPNNLVFLIDVSGSMETPDKLPLVKAAFRLLVNELRPTDRVSIVVYAGNAGLVLPSTPGSHKERILDAIEGLEAGGSTAGGAGIQLAYQVAREHFIAEGNNRVILATDGDFNVGASSDGELVRMIEAKREHGIFLTVLGFGSGNLKDAKMEQLADKGNGHYAYVDNLLEAKKVFVRELGATLYTIAKDVKLQVEFNPAKVAAYRLVGYEKRILADQDFNDDSKDAGDMGAGHSVTALYEIVPVGAPLDVAVGSVDPLKYQREHEGHTGAGDWFTVKLRYKDPAASTSKLLERVVRGESDRPSSDFRFASAVAGIGMLLRDSEHKGSATFDRMLALARGAKGEDDEGYRAEFIRLMEAAALLKEHGARESTGRR